MKRSLALLLALVLCVSLGAAACAEEDWTVLVYICGSDLESEDSMASENMQQMIDADTDSNIRFVVETGGASYWYNEASTDALDRFLITEGECELVGSRPLASMGEAETLADFLRWGLTEYPAAHVGLIFWDHGSGSINGVCFDELCGDESLFLREIDEALCGVQGLLPGGFEFIGFDACLMATVENAAMLAPHARYLVASEEVEPGGGWDYEAIGSYLDENPSADGRSLGKAICDSYYVNCIRADDEGVATLSVTELGKLEALRTAFDAYAEDLFSATEQGADFAPIARAIAAADNFGGNNRSEGYTNMVDLGGLIAAGESWSSRAKAARAALDAAIVYQVLGSDHTQASGLSVYYPLKLQGSAELGIFKDVCISAYYLGLVDKLAYGFANGGGLSDYDNKELIAEYQESWTGEDYGGAGYSYDDSAWDWLDTAQDDGQSEAIGFDEEPCFDDDGVFGFILSEEGLYNTESVEAVVYLISDDEEDAVCIGYTSDVLADWDYGIFEDNFDGYWFSLPDGQCLCVYLVEECDGYDLFTSPVEVNGEEKNLRFAWDYENDEVAVLDLWDGIGGSGAASRPGETLQPGDRIVPLYDAFSLSSDDEYQYYGEEYVWEYGDELYFDLLPDGEYLYAFCINDIFGGSYLTDFVGLYLEDGEVWYDAA